MAFFRKYFLITLAFPKTRLVSEKALEKSSLKPVFPVNLRKLFQKLKFWKSLTLLFVFAGFLFSCGNLSPPTPSRPYRPISRVRNAVVVGSIETNFFSQGIPGWRDEHAIIGENAYYALLAAAKEIYGDNVDIFDITWTERHFHRYPEPSEFFANGKVVYISYYEGIETVVERAAKDAVRNVPKESIIAIVYFTASDRLVVNFITNELELIWLNEGYIISDRRQLEILRQEQNFQLSGEVDDASAISIGKVMGASVIVTGSLDGAGHLRRLRLRLLDTQTGRLIGAASEQL